MIHFLLRLPAMHARRGFNDSDEEDEGETRDLEQWRLQNQLDKQSRSLDALLDRIKGLHGPSSPAPATASATTSPPYRQPLPAASPVAMDADLHHAARRFSEEAKNVVTLQHELDVYASTVAEARDRLDEVRDTSNRDTFPPLGPPAQPHPQLFLRPFGACSYNPRAATSSAPGPRPRAQTDRCVAT